MEFRITDSMEGCVPCMEYGEWNSMEYMEWNGMERTCDFPILNSINLLGFSIVIYWI
jgi:hypothetical protein